MANACSPTSDLIPMIGATAITAAKAEATPIRGKKERVAQTVMNKSAFNDAICSAA